MQFGSLAAHLMQKTVRAAGDGASKITVKYIGQPVYDPDTGHSVTPTTPFDVLHAFVGAFTDEERARHNLNSTAQKIIIARADLPNTPSADDLVTIGVTEWRIVKAMEDLVKASTTLAVVPV